MTFSLKKGLSSVLFFGVGFVLMSNVFVGEAQAHSASSCRQEGNSKAYCRSHHDGGLTDEKHRVLSTTDGQINGTASYTSAGNGNNGNGKGNGNGNGGSSNANVNFTIKAKRVGVAGTFQADKGSSKKGYAMCKVGGMCLPAGSDYTMEATVSSGSDVGKRACVNNVVVTAGAVTTVDFAVTSTSSSSCNLW